MNLKNADGDYTHIFEDLLGAVCCLDEGLVIVEGKFLSGVEDQSTLLSKMVWFQLWERQHHKWFRR